MTTSAPEHFNAIAGQYAASEVHVNSPTIRRLHELLAPKRPDSVCDVACGPGHLALSFAGKVSRMVGVDAAPNMLRQTEAVPPSSRWGYTRIAFICARESLGEKHIGPQLKAAFDGSYFANENFTQATAGQVLAAGKVGAVVFGVPFLANPDLLERFRQNAPLNEPDPSTFYTSGPKGCTDYPALDKTFVNGSQPMKLSKTELSF